jgi:hypothetical protein
MTHPEYKIRVRLYFQIYRCDFADIVLYAEEIEIGVIRLAFGASATG